MMNFDDVDDDGDDNMRLEQMCLGNPQILDVHFQILLTPEHVVRFSSIWLRPIPDEWRSTKNEKKEHTRTTVTEINSGGASAVKEPGHFEVR